MKRRSTSGGSHVRRRGARWEMAGVGSVVGGMLLGALGIADDSLVALGAGSAAVGLGFIAFIVGRIM